MTADCLEAARYYLAAQLLGWIAFPWCFRLLRGLPDRGYVAAKLLGPALLCWGAWLGAHGLWPHVAATLWLLTAAALTGALALCGVRRAALGQYLRQRSRYLLAAEILFLAVYIFGCLVRALAPEITFEIARSGAEKFSDFTLFHNLYHSVEFPARDTWLAGFHVNYYYCGHLLHATLAKLSGAPAGTGYNLALALTAAWTAAMAFALGFQLLKSIRWAAAAALPAALGGNLEPLRQLLHWLQIHAPLFHEQGAAVYFKTLAAEFPGGVFAHFDFWASSRVIPPAMITEFPMFSYLLGDLHPHVIALPFAVLALQLAAALGRGVFRCRSRPAVLLFDQPANWLAAAFVLGFLSAANLWDYYTLQALQILMLAGAALVWGAGLAQKLKLALCTAGALMLVAAFGKHILFFPFQATFQPPFETSLHVATVIPPRATLNWPLRIVPVELRSPGGPFLLHWLLFLAPALAWTAPGGLLRLLNCEWRKFFFLVLLLSAAAVAGWNLGQNLAVPLLALLGIALWLGVPPRPSEPGGVNVRLIFSGALCVLIGVELVFVDDPFGGDDERMNTLFKATYPLWPPLAVCAAWLWRRVIRQTGPRTLQAFARALLILSCTLAALYPLLGVGARLKERERFPGRAGTLNGLAHLERDPVWRDDFLLAQWMSRELPRRSVVLEACGETYAPDGRIACWSAIPSVLGWEQHESVWRGGAAEQHIRRLSLAARRVYSETDLEAAQRLGVHFIVWGALEEQRFGPRAAERLELFLPLLKQFGRSRLYVVEFPADGAQLDSASVIGLQVAPDLRVGG